MANDWLAVPESETFKFLDNVKIRGAVHSFATCQLGYDEAMIGSLAANDLGFYCAKMGRAEDVVKCTLTMWTSSPPC